MKQSGKSVRVSWAPGVNLCQVRLFETEDCPTRISTQVRSHVQKKPLWVLQDANSQEFNDPPPGFKGSRLLNASKAKLSSFPRIKWKFPSKFVISCSWHVAAGEQSQEAETQQLREMRVLEAVYPRLSDIPASPCVSKEMEGENYDDSLTPVVPLTPIEEEEVADTPSNLLSSENPSFSSRPLPFEHSLLSSGSLNSSRDKTPASEQLTTGKSVSGNLFDASANLITAASAALTAIMYSREEGSLVDSELLVKIFSDPKMILKLVNENQAPKSVASMPVYTSQPAARPMHSPSGEIRSILEPEMRLNSQSCPKPSMLVAPMPTNGGLQHMSVEVPPVATRLNAQPETSPMSGIKRSVLSLSTLTPEPIKVSAPMPKVENLYSRPCHLQTLSSSIPNPPNGFPNCSSTAMRPNPLNNLVPPSTGMITDPISLPQTYSGDIRTNPVKDVNYIKNLIREHGVEKPEVQDRSMPLNSDHQSLSLQNIKMRDVKTKFQKPCIYFKSSRGCRNGSNCPYQHDLIFRLQTDSTLGIPSAKRMKLGAEITGWT